MPWTHPASLVDKHQFFTEVVLSSNVFNKSLKARLKNFFTSSVGPSRTNDAKVEYFASSDPDGGGQGNTRILLSLPLFSLLVSWILFGSVLQISGLDGDLPPRPKRETLVQLYNRETITWIYMPTFLGGGYGSPWSCNYVCLSICRTYFRAFDWQQCCNVCTNSGRFLNTVRKDIYNFEQSSLGSSQAVT